MGGDRATGQAVNIKRINDGLDMNMNNNGFVGVHSSGDIILGSPNSDINTRRIWVTNTAQQILTQLDGRKKLTVQNNSEEDFYLGSNSSLTSGDGLVIYAQSMKEFDLGSSIQPYIIKNVAGSGDCRLMEIA